MNGTSRATSSIERIDDTKHGHHARGIVFGKSIIRPPPPPARRPVRVPGLPWRTLAFALLAVVGAGYAVARQYRRRMSPDAGSPDR